VAYHKEEEVTSSCLAAVVAVAVVVQPRVVVAVSAAPAPLPLSHGLLPQLPPFSQLLPFQLLPSHELPLVRGPLSRVCGWPLLPLPLSSCVLVPPLLSARFFLV